MFECVCVYVCGCVCAYVCVCMRACLCVSVCVCFVFDMTAMPMSPTPMMIETGMPMSPSPQYIPITPVGQYSTATTPTPFAFPNQTNQNPMSFINSPPQTFDYGCNGFQQMQVVPQDNPNSFLDESSQMQIASPLMSPIHC